MQIAYVFALSLVLASPALLLGDQEGSRNRIVETARSQIGVKEDTGKNDGRMVDTYLASTGLAGSRAPWCAAFIVWVGDTAFGASIFNPYPRSAWSPSFLVKPTWDRQRRGTPLKPADVFGIWFNSMGRVAHVGIVERNEGDWLVTIEGNTNGGGSRDGDGVYRRRRMAVNVLGRDWL